MEFSHLQHYDEFFLSSNVCSGQSNHMKKKERKSAEVSKKTN